MYPLTVQMYIISVYTLSPLGVNNTGGCMHKGVKHDFYTKLLQLWEVYVYGTFPLATVKYCVHSELSDE